MENEAPTPLNPEPQAPAPDLSAGFWLRAGAYMIDGILIAVVSVVLNLLLPEALSIAARILLSAGYFTLLPVRNQGQTLGKMAAGVTIVRDDGSPLTYWHTFARWLGYLLSGITLCLGFACAAFTKRKRALHDYVAGTRVVKVQEIASGRKFAVILAGVLFPLLVALGIAAAVALPRLPGIPDQAGEETTIGNLGALRSAAAAYENETKSGRPADLNVLAPKYLPAVPPAGVPEHPGAAGVEVYGPEVCSGSQAPGQELVAAKLRDTGRWGYVVAPGAPCDGKIFVDCTHPDSKGGAWYAD